MKKHVVLFSLVMAALIAAPSIHAQDSKPDKKVKAAEAEKAGKKQGVVPMHGKVAAVDAAAGTITVGKMTINITSATKIHKGGKPATISDINVGDRVAGAYKKDESGKLNATMIRVGEKQGDGPAKKKKAAAEEKSE